MHPLLQNIESSPDALKKMKSAASAELTPVSVDADAQSGYFIGHSGKYTVTLDICPCGSFRQNRKPCKHMYRLAHELGVIHLDNVVSDASKIHPEETAGITPAKRKEAVDYCIKAIEAAGEASAKALQDMFAYRNAVQTRKQPYPCDDLSPLTPFFADGLLKTVESPETILTTFGKKASVDALIASGYAFPPALKKTVSARFDYCLAHAAALVPIICPKWQVIAPANQLIIAEKKVYEYLNSRFPREVIIYF